MGYKHNRIKELWYNRPSQYIPAVVRFVKRYPLTKDGNLKIYIRNVLRLNWQCSLRRVSK